MVLILKVISTVARYHLLTFCRFWAAPAFVLKSAIGFYSSMKDLIFQDDIYFTLTAEQAEWAVASWTKVLLHRGMIPGRIPSESEIARIKTAIPGVLNGSPQEDLGYILHSASKVHWD